MCSHFILDLWWILFYQSFFLSVMMLIFSVYLNVSDVICACGSSTEWILNSDLSCADVLDTIIWVMGPTFHFVYVVFHFTFFW